jgi:hypothetical protein
MPCSYVSGRVVSDQTEHSWAIMVGTSRLFPPQVRRMYTAPMAPLPLAVSDIWKVYEWANRRKTDNKAAVVEWLDAVYSDLEEVSKVWIRIADSSETAYIDGDVKTFPSFAANES